MTTNTGPMTRAKRGLGSVFLRGRIWWVQYSVRGRKVRRTSGSEKQSVAVKFLRKQLEAVTAGRHELDSDRFTFEDLATLLVNDYQANGRRSLDRAKRSVAHLRKAFGHDQAIDI